MPQYSMHMTQLLAKEIKFRIMLSVVVYLLNGYAKYNVIERTFSSLNINILKISY